eukprot:GEZU01028019.1.p1 GENE.GEZU01028019.1~~GEZU01028019.1.p1  ORF type:complete len:796 (-),score=288.15 GEZU01028019.1:122-2509(-)
MSKAGQPEQLTPEEEQEKWLADAKKQVLTQAFHMKRALDKNLLNEALKHASTMLSELRTSLLTPKNYYALYMIVFDELRHLEQFFQDEHQLRGRRVEELYELVQYAGNIVPRLYLLITVGSVYIKSKEAPAKDILKDLVEMAKGVQHPTRGLFLRNYLSQMARDKLPDKGSEYEGEGGTVLDAIDFVLQNFNEMVRLWIRLQNMGLNREREKREKERLELRILVGTNLVRLSQLDGVDLDLYQNNVLPRVIDIIVNCKDQIAQQYLMECIIQVFPDEFHLATLRKFLSSCLDLQQGVDLKAIFTSLMDRLANYFQNASDLAAALEAHQTPDGNIFDTFVQYIDKTLQKGMDTVGFLTVQISLANLALKCYPEKVEYVNTILANCATQIAETTRKVEDKKLKKLVMSLLTIPIDSYKNVLTLLELTNYTSVMSLLTYPDRRTIAIEICKSALKYLHEFTTWEQVNKLFELIRPLVKDEEDQPDEDELDEEDFAEEQNLVARLVHLFNNEDTDVLFKVYSAARKQFGQGGVRRIQYTLVPLVFAYLRLAQRINEAVENGVDVAIREGKVFQYTLEVLEVLASQKPDVALKLYLQAAQTADKCNLEKIVYELMSQAFILYEEEVSDTKVQLSLLTQMIATLQTLANVGEENYDTLATKACQYSSKLLRKTDQCRAAFLCSHLFWQQEEEFRNSSKVLECLQRSLKIVESCMASQQIPLFVEILNKYLYHFDEHNEKVTIKYLNSLIDLINSNITRSDAEEETTEQPGVAPINVFYNNTIKHIQHKKQTDPDHYADVKV